MRFLSTLVAVAIIGMHSTIALAQNDVSRVLITDVNIFDGQGDELSMHRDVLIEGNKIKSIGQDLAPPEGAVVIRGEGRTLMPGLIDAHVHLSWNTVGGPFVDGHPDYLAALGLCDAEHTLLRRFTTVLDPASAGRCIDHAVQQG